MFRSGLSLLESLSRFRCRYRHRSRSPPSRHPYLSHPRPRYLFPPPYRRLHPPAAKRCSSSDAIVCVPGAHRSSVPADAGEGFTSVMARAVDGSG